MLTRAFSRLDILASRKYRGRSSAIDARPISKVPGESQLCETHPVDDKLTSCSDFPSESYFAGMITASIT